MVDYGLFIFWGVGGWDWFPESISREIWGWQGHWLFTINQPNARTASAGKNVDQTKWIAKVCSQGQKSISIFALGMVQNSFLLLILAKVRVFKVTTLLNAFWQLGDLFRLLLFSSQYFLFLQHWRCLNLKQSNLSPLNFSNRLQRMAHRLPYTVQCLKK